MPNVNLKVDQLFANVQEAILVIPTPTVSEILVLPILVVLMQFVKTMEMLPSANVLQTMLEIHTFLARLIPVLKIPVALIPSVLSVVKDLSVDVFEDTLEVQLVDKVVSLIPVLLTIFVAKMPNVEMREVDQLANVYLVIREIHTKDVFVEIVFLIQSAQIISLCQGLKTMPTCMTLRRSMAT